MKFHSSLVFFIASAISPFTATSAATLRGQRGHQHDQENNAMAATSRLTGNKDIPAVDKDSKTQQMDVMEQRDLVGIQPNVFDLDARRLGLVHTENGDRWEMNSSGDKGWTEYWADGKETFAWKEVDRDVNSVYLESPDETARIDLYLGIVEYCFDQYSCDNKDTEKFTITSAHKINKFGLNAQDLRSVNVNNGDQWVSRGKRVWIEIKADGLRRFQWKETGRDLHSVYLEDDHNKLPGTTAQIDLHSGEVTFCPLGFCFTRGDITAAS